MLLHMSDFVHQFERINLSLVTSLLHANATMFFSNKNCSTCSLICSPPVKVVKIVESKEII